MCLFCFRDSQLPQAVLLWVTLPLGDDFKCDMYSLISCMRWKLNLTQQWKLKRSCHLFGNDSRKLTCSVRESCIRRFIPRDILNYRQFLLSENFNMRNSSLFEGDMILSKDQQERAEEELDIDDSRHKRATSRSRLWPRGVVKYKIDVNLGKFFREFVWSLENVH